MNRFSKKLLTGAWILLLLFKGTHAPWLPSSHLQASTFTIPAQHVSIAELLSNSPDFHLRLVAVRGIVSQPELHLDDSELFIDFVFRLEDGDQSVVVFGRHDRTQGAPTIALDLSVEVIGVFWKERDLHDSRIINTIEALTVDPYPSLIPENA